MLGQLIISLILGAVAGWIAGKIMKSSHGLLMNINKRAVGQSFCPHIVF